MIVNFLSYENLHFFFAHLIKSLMWGFMICSVIHYLKNLLLKGKKEHLEKLP